MTRLWDRRFAGREASAPFHASSTFTPDDKQRTRCLSIHIISFLNTPNPHVYTDRMACQHFSTSPPTSKPPSMHDSARGSPEPTDGFHKLVNEINSVLGPCNGIDSAGIDVEQLKRLMAEYTSNEVDWDRYAFADYTRGYTRNLVDSCNGKSNLVSLHVLWATVRASCVTWTNIYSQLILVWTPGKASPIHDHANAHCVMKVLTGSLTETLYAWPCQHVDNSSDCTTSPSNPCPSTDHTCSST